MNKAITTLILSCAVLNWMLWSVVALYIAINNPNKWGFVVLLVPVFVWCIYDAAMGLSDE